MQNSAMKHHKIFRSIASPPYKLSTFPFVQPTTKIANPLAPNYANSIR